MRIKAIIFDMDGVIIDSMPMHLTIWQKIFHDRSLPRLTLKEFERYNGTSTLEIAEKIIKKYNLSEKPESIVKEKHDIEKKIQGKKIRIFPDAIKTIDYLKEEGYKVAIATSEMPHMVRYIKKRFKLQQHLNTIVHSSQVRHSKPSPDLFLLASKRLKVKPEECIVIEDAVNGIIAANKAGMISVAITNTFKRKAFSKNADHIIGSLKEIRPILEGD